LRACVCACVMAGRGSRACVTKRRKQLVLARGGGCVRACECVEAGRRLTGVWGWLGGGVLGFLCCGVGAGTKGTGATAICTDEASRPGPAVKGESGVGVVAGVSQQQAAAEHEAACGRGGRGRGRGVRACERAQRVGACVMARRGSRACATEGRGQLVLARGGVCVRACECVEAGRRLTGVWGWLGGGVLGFHVAGWGQVRRGLH
jgi:hypothetical protein